MPRHIGYVDLVGVGALNYLYLKKQNLKDRLALIFPCRNLE